MGAAYRSLGALCAAKFVCMRAHVQTPEVLPSMSWPLCMGALRHQGCAKCVEAQKCMPFFV